MSFVNITVPLVGEATRQSLISDVIGDLNDLNSRLLAVTAGSVIPNGSFEADTAAANTTPTSWTWTQQTGGTRSIVATSGDQASGRNSFKATRTSGGSDGGGALVTTDFIEVSPQRKFFLQWLMKCTSASLKNIVKVFWYKYDQSASATASTTIYSEASASPTAWTLIGGEAVVPADAKYCKVEFTLCDSSGTAVAGSTYIDGVSLASRYNSTRDFRVTTAGTYSFTAPATAHYRITLIGGGGAGQTRATNTGSGGGGGETAIGYVHLTSGTTYTVVVGAGGGTSTTNGNDSTFNSTTIVAKAGTGGNTDGAGGGAGGTGGTVPTGGIKIDGQTGGTTGAQYGGSSAYGLGGGAGGGGVGGTGNSPGGGGGGGTTFGAGGAGGAIIEWNA